MTQAEPRSSVKSAIEKHKEFLFPAVATYYQEPIALVKGEGEYVWDDQGNRYLDCFGGVLTVSVGHANPRVNEAVHRAEPKIQHTSTLYANPNQSNLAEKLPEITPGQFEEIVLYQQRHRGRRYRASWRPRSLPGGMRSSCCGTAIPAVRRRRCRRSATQPGVRCRAGRRHRPRTGAVLLPLSVQARIPECGVACAKDIEELIQTTTTGEIAAFMAEPILGVGGFIVPPPEYFQIAYDIARKHGGLCIADEVQTAWGRTGDKWFGIEHWDVEPDIMTSAKGMANGIPIGWTIATPEVADKFPGLTFATFGGNPVSTAAALAVIKMIEDDDLRTNCRVVGEYLRQGLDGLKEKYPVIGDVRGMGLMQGIELVKDRTTKEPAPQAVLTVFEETKRQGVLIGKGGLYGNVIRTGMMLNSTKDNVDELIRALDAGLALC